MIGWLVVGWTSAANPHAFEAFLQELHLAPDAFAREAHGGDAHGLEEGSDERVGTLADGGLDHCG